MLLTTKIFFFGFVLYRFAWERKIRKKMCNNRENLLFITKMWLTKFPPMALCIKLNLDSVLLCVVNFREMIYNTSFQIVFLFTTTIYYVVINKPMIFFSSFFILNPWQSNYLAFKLLYMYNYINYDFHCIFCQTLISIYIVFYLLT